MNVEGVLGLGLALLGVSALVWMRSAEASIPTGPLGVSMQLDSAGEPEPLPEVPTFNPLFTDEEQPPVQIIELPPLRHFSPAEFRQWWPKMSNDLLYKLDEFRELWGAPVVISSHPDALGRNAGESRSYHNVDRWGEVRAVDVFPRGLTKATAARALACAEQAGLGGIGIYTDTSPSMMMHLDNRAGRGRWARVAGKWVGIDHAMA